MVKVQVLLSAYNGEKYIEEQVNSILNQSDIDVSCLIRDDGSTDDTLKALERYKDNSKVRVLKADNVGWKKSFYDLVFKSDDNEYYAFADQDDVWLEEKISKAIEKLKVEDDNIPLLYYSDATVVDENLKVIGYKKNIAPPIKKESSLLMCYGQGCTMVFNKCARNLFKKYYINDAISHECWMSILCIYFGKVIYDNNSYILYRQHGDNASGAKTPGVLVLLKRQLKKIMSGNVYISYYKYLYDGYKELLKDDELNTILDFINYKKSWKAKKSLLFNSGVARYSKKGTFFLKIAILFSKFGGE